MQNLHFSYIYVQILISWFWGMYRRSSMPHDWLAPCWTWWIKKPKVSSVYFRWYYHNALGCCLVLVRICYFYIPVEVSAGINRELDFYFLWALARPQRQPRAICDMEFKNTTAVIIIKKLPSLTPTRCSTTYSSCFTTCWHKVALTWEPEAVVGSLAQLLNRSLNVAQSTWVLPPKSKSRAVS